MITPRTGAAFVAVLIGLSTTLVTARAIVPEWVRRNGLDVWNANEALRAHRVATEEGAEVSAVVERDARRRATAQQIAARLSATPGTLPAAADELMEVFEDDAGMRCTLRQNHPGAPTVRHAFALHVIDRVRARLDNDPARRADVVARLEVEYRAMCEAPESPAHPEVQRGP
jgi:hypothetical protein